MGIELIRKQSEVLEEVCSLFEVDELSVFGSILTSKFNPESDIDFVVSISSTDPIEYAENYFNLKFELEKIFERKIDLLEERSIRNKVFKDLVNKQKAIVYARGNKGMA
ncbi:nucleotidyltransferase family protein [Phaeodactylibacter xiamenensis]|uniref:nucleotidyltransferase family protein n=1 Tax=Phaeodactylibacter xiamenensis TaxID=1524460 RepID=UPI003CCB94E5